MPGLYIHIPFCEKKCIYCSFYSIEALEGKERFLDAIVREIDMRAELLEGDPDAPRSYETVFFGGGTPSLLSPDELGRIMRRLRERFTIEPDAEITMECNPGTLNRDWLTGYRDLGVNRLSFGVQSFHDDELAFLSRIHSAEEARRSIGLAREIFENVSLDLIFALPGQTHERWRHNLREAVELDTAHISAYSLIFEEGTRLNVMRLNGQVAPAVDVTEAEMFEETVAWLSAHGYRQYEVSNHARPGRECRHNLGYWERRTYISFGPSAHGFIRRENEGDFRWANISNLTAWLDAIDAGRLPVATREELTPIIALEETVMLGLRSRGLPLDEFERIAGAGLRDLTPDLLTMLEREDYARLDADRLSLTAKGYLFADRFALQIIHAAERALPHLEQERPAPAMIQLNVVGS
jgi:oxygen-independent coproporphyrinogen III oxidase